MDKPRFRPLTAVLSVLVVLGGLAAWTSWSTKQRLDQLVREGGHLGEVDPQAWSQLAAGMSQRDVVELLGTRYFRRSRYVQVRATDEEGRRLALPLPATDAALVGEHVWWEYGWTDGLSSPLQGASVRAWVVSFDAQGRVSAFREPLVTPPPRRDEG